MKKKKTNAEHILGYCFALLTLSTTQIFVRILSILKSHEIVQRKNEQQQEEKKTDEIVQVGFFEKFQCQTVWWLHNADWAQWADDEDGDQSQGGIEREREHKSHRFQIFNNRKLHLAQPRKILTWEFLVFVILFVIIYMDQVETTVLHRKQEYDTQHCTKAIYYSFLPPFGCLAYFLSHPSPISH